MTDRWVTFDCFGTLMDWHTGFRRALAPIAGEDADGLIEAYQAAELQTLSERPWQLYEEVLRSALQRAADARGVCLAASDADVLSRTWADMPIFPDTEASLKRIVADGWKIAVLTNCDDALFAETARTLPVAFDLVVTAQQVGSYKPDPGHFLEFERRSGVRRDRWVHAGVSWHHDMRAAQQFGIARIWVDRDDTGQDPSICTAHIRDMASLPDTLRRLGVT